MTTCVEFPPKLRCLFEPSRYKVLYGGRGGAKSWGVARALLLMGVKRKLRVLCAREFQNSIRDSVHRLLADQVERLGLQRFYNVQQQSIRGPRGTEFAFEGLRHNVSRIKSYEGVDVVWCEEAEKISKDSWNVLIPTIRKDRSEIWVTFNPEFEDDETYVRFVLNPPTDAKIVNIGWRDNPWFPKVLEQERLELQRRDPDGYDHVWEGRCRRWLEGAIYAKELREAYEGARIRVVPHDPSVPVYTAWDIGRTDDTAVWWWQMAGGEIHVIDAYAQTGGDPSVFASQVLGVNVTIGIGKDGVTVERGAPIEELAHRRAYNYATHWLPHDARAKTFAAHGKSTQEQLAHALGWENVNIVPSLSLEDGIMAARSMFPRVYIDGDRCADGLKALRKYRRALKADQVSLQARPAHDWTSHYADAWRMMAVAWQERPQVAAPAPVPHDAYALDDDDIGWRAA